MSRKLFILCLSILSLMVEGCVYPFEPEGIENTSGMIVIEGDILAGEYSSFKLSLSEELDGTRSEIFLLWKVSIESSTGEVISSAMTTSSTNTVDTRDISLDKKYRVRIDTQDSKTNESKYYYSEWLDVQKAAVLDDVTFYPDWEQEIMFFYVSSHGEETQNYYKWEYQEDWEYHSQNMAYAEYDPKTNTITDILGIRNRYYCWNNAASTKIMVADNSAMGENKLIRHELFTIGKSSIKISYLYSVNVIQKALTAEAYNYWNTLSRNSDDAGGIFSPQPSELRGNYFNPNDSSEVVLGYVSATTVSSKRIFVDNFEVKFWSEKEDCQDDITLKPDQFRTYYNSGFDILYSEEMDGVVVYYWADKNCTDCRMKGGTKTKPSFWPNEHK